MVSHAGGGRERKQGQQWGCAAHGAVPGAETLDLQSVAGELGQPKEDVALEALVEWIKDRADALSAETVLARNEPTTTLEEMRREFGLER